MVPIYEPKTFDLLLINCPNNKAIVVDIVLNVEKIILPSKIFSLFILNTIPIVKLSKLTDIANNIIINTFLIIISSSSFLVLKIFIANTRNIIEDK